MAENTQEIKIRISGDASGAEKAVSGASSGLKGLSAIAGRVNGAFRAIGAATKFLGRLNWAIQAVVTLWQGLQKVQEWMHRAETAAKALREELAKSNYENAVARAADAYKKLNKDLTETIRLEKERNAILDARKATERDIEDADAERRKQLEISRLDPNADNYAEQKKAIERRYEIAASDTKAARAGDDIRAEAKSLYDQAASKDREAARLEKEWKRADAITERAVERKFKAGMEARNGDEDAKKRSDEAEEDFKKAFDFAAKIKEEMEKARKEAESLRRQAAEKTGGNLAANIRNDAEKQRIANEAKAEAAEKKRKDDEEAKRKADEAAKEQKTRDQNLEDRTLARKKEEDLAALNPASPDYERQKKEVEYTYAAKELENKAARAENDTDRQAAKEELKALDIRYGAETRNAAIEQGIAAAERAASFDGVSQNRLTAMGLGDGTQGSSIEYQRSILSDMRQVVSLLRDQTDTIREQSRINGRNETAIFGE